jgi:hypothetical protein
MRALRDRARLAVEALAELRVKGERLGQNLDRHGAIEPRVPRLEPPVGSFGSSGSGGASLGLAMSGGAPVGFQW